MSRVISVSIIFFASIVFSYFSFAIDNPDLPDYVSQFNSRAKPFEQNIANRAGAAPAEIAGLYNAYYLFLDEATSSVESSTSSQAQLSKSSFLPPL